MNPSPVAPVRPRRRVWPWLVGSALFCMGCAVIAVAQCFLLDHDAMVLHRRAAAVFGSSLHRRVQGSVGLTGIVSARFVLRCIDDVPPEAREALAAVRSASFGVFELERIATPVERARLLREADAAMTARGWSRLVGVAEHENLVAVYADPSAEADTTQRLCLLVCDHHDLVIVSAEADPAPLARLAAAHGGRLALD